MVVVSGTKKGRSTTCVADRPNHEASMVLLE